MSSSGASRSAAAEPVRFGEALQEAGWLVLLATTPLAFLVDAGESFELIKAALLRGVVVLMLFGGLLARLFRPGSPPTVGLRHVPRLAVAAAAVGAATVLSAALSISPETSWWGTLRRSQGALTTLAYLTAFFMVASGLRKTRQWRRLTATLILASVPVALYALVQRAALDPVSWASTTEGRVGSTLGNPIFLGGYLLFPIFAALDRAIESIRARAALATGALWIGVIGLDLAALLLTGSRGPLLGLLVGGLAYVLLLGAGSIAPDASARDRAQSRRWLLGASIAVVAVLVTLAAIGSSARLRERFSDWPVLGRFAYTFVAGTETGRVRTLAWEGVAKLIASRDPIAVPGLEPDSWPALRPLVGYGPETLALVSPRFLSPELARLEPGAALDRAHNESFDVVATGGLLGIVVMVWLQVEVLRLGVGGARWILAGGALGAFLASVAVESRAYWGLGLGMGLVAGFLLTSVLAVLRPRRVPAEALAVRSPQLSWVVAALVAHLVELQPGIAVTSTRLCFWILTGALVASLLCADRGFASDDDVLVDDAPAAGLVAALITTTLVFGLAPHVLLAAQGARWLAMDGSGSGAARALAVLAVVLITWLAALCVAMVPDARSGRAVRASGRRLAAVSAGAIAVAAGILVVVESPRADLLGPSPSFALRLADHAGRRWTVFLVVFFVLSLALACALMRAVPGAACHRGWRARRPRAWIAAAVAAALAALAIRTVAFGPVAASIDAHYAAIALEHEPATGLALARRAVARDSHQAHYRALLDRALRSSSQSPRTLD